MKKKLEEGLVTLSNLVAFSVDLGKLLTAKGNNMDERYLDTFR